jgi:hypothetical protein
MEEGMLQRNIHAIKHNVSLAASALSRITDWGGGTTTGNSEFEVAAKEGTFTFRTVTDNHGFQLMDCTSTMI